jgi:RNA polymerase sigma-70 factor, ECF subfamily
MSTSPHLGSLSIVNEQHLAAIYKRWGPVVYRRCLRVLDDREEARDATQQVFIQLLRHGDRFESDPDAVIAWLQSVATNVSLTTRRNHGRRGAKLQAMQEDEARVEGADEAWGNRQLAQRALDAADPDDRQVAERVLVSGQSHEDAASELGVSQKTVQRRLHRFLDGARKLLGRSS